MSLAAAVEALAAGDFGRIEELFRADPGLAEARDERGLSLLLLAAYVRAEDVVELLLSAQPQLDLPTAAALGHEDRVADLLRENRALAGEVSGDGFTALHLACYFRRSACVGLLLEHGADPERQAENEAALKPLHSAAAGGSLAALMLLLDHDADPNVQQKGGWTPLHAAAAAGWVEGVEALLSNEADPELGNDEGQRPIDLARERDHGEVVRLLEAHA